MKMPPSATATLLLIAAFLGGLFAGVLLERTFFGAIPDAHAAVQPPVAREGGAWDRQRLATELELTDEQQARIDRILAEQQSQVRAILSETRPRTRAILKETRRQVEEVLSPEQQARWQEMYREAHRHGAKSGRMD